MQAERENAQERGRPVIFRLSPVEWGNKADANGAQGIAQRSSISRPMTGVMYCFAEHDVDLSDGRAQQVQPCRKCQFAVYCSSLYASSCGAAGLPQRHSEALFRCQLCGMRMGWGVRGGAMCAVRFTQILVKIAYKRDHVPLVDSTLQFRDYTAFMLRTS